MPRRATATGTRRARGSKLRAPRWRDSKRIAAEQKLPDEIVAPWRERERQRIAQFETERNPKGDGFTLSAGVHRAELALIEAERARLNELLREGKVTDEIRRRIERGLDLDEERLRRNVRGISSDDDDDDGPDRA